MRNIILLTLDAFNYDLFINNINNLPNLLQLKKSGVFFKNAFSVGPATAFSFPAIVGSVYPYWFGIKISKDIQTIDSMLKEYGYNTAFINEANALLTPFFGYGRKLDFQDHFLSLSHAAVDRKLQNTFLESKSPHILKPMEFMRDIYMKLADLRTRNFARYVYGISNLLRLYLAGSSENFRERRNLYNTFRDKIVKFINEDFKEPQFIWIHTIINHLPYLPYEETSKFSEREINHLNYRGLCGLINTRISKKLKSLYIESLRKTDQLVGEIIDNLKKNDLLYNSLVIVTADHGEEFEKTYVGHDPKSSSDMLLHVPLVFSSPLQFKGKSISIPVSSIDILPTIADLLEMQIPHNARGKSLKSFILNHPIDSRKEGMMRQRALYSEAWDIGNPLNPKSSSESNSRIFTVRDDRHRLKITEKNVGNGIKTEFELFDWIDRKQLDIQTNSQLIHKLRHLLYMHLYEEEVFYESIVGEKERIRRNIGKLKEIESHRSL